MPISRPLLCLPLLLASAPALAVNYHVGFGVGPALYDANPNTFDDGSLNNSGRIDTHSFGFTVYGESRFSPYLRVEYGGLDGQGGSFDGTSDGTGTYYASGNVDITYALGGLKVGAVGTLPLGGKFNLLAKGGLALWIMALTLKDNSVIGQEIKTQSGLSPYFGVGAEVELTDLISLRLMLEQLSASANNPFTGKDIDMTYRLSSLGLLFRF